MCRAGIATLCGLLWACSGTITPSTPGDDDDDIAPAADGAPGSPDAAPGAPDATPADPTLSPEEQALLDTINAERVGAGLVAVEPRMDLNCAAERHSLDIGETQTCTHTGSDGSSPTDRVRDCGGGGWTGEIVACGQSTPRAAVDAWIASPGHNAIMFDGGQRYVGVAMHNNFWTAIFDR